MLPLGVEHCVGSVLVALTIAGVSFTTTVVLAFDVQLPKVAVTLYTPFAASVTSGIEGFWLMLVKLFGPIQL